ncbi:MAG: TetR/AcrR family transcriptional regulator [Cyclobacteriaceae bacterium]|jgi:TetR/AcrR family transcriptional regulator, transcriptional repressor for nem operon|nr:TetR/AcrR family transcriptional regulator [Cyclobacteriaceae bacterium]
MRYKEFNRNKVLDHCISLFWKNGFNSSSINEIVSITGVNRFSLYKEFGNKEGILYSALELYNDRYFSENLNVLNQKKDLRETLMEFFASLLSETRAHSPG